MHESGEDPDDVRYCGVSSCWCHSNDEYHDTFTNSTNMLACEPDDNQLSLVYRFYGIQFETEYVA